MESEINNVMLPASKAEDVLGVNFYKIDSAEEWSFYMNWSCATRFSRRFRKYTGKRPSRVLIETKIETVINLLQNHPELSCFEVAERIGNADDKALNKFLKHQTKRAPSWFRAHPEYRLNSSVMLNKNRRKTKDSNRR